MIAGHSIICGECSTPPVLERPLGLASALYHLDFRFDVDWLAHRIVDGGELEESLELLGRCVSLDLEGCADILVSGPDVFVQAEESPQVEIPFEL